MSAKMGQANSQNQPISPTKDEVQKDRKNLKLFLLFTGCLLTGLVITTAISWWMDLQAENRAKQISPTPMAITPTPSIVPIPSESPSAQPTDTVFCTQEVKLCPDGKTYVGRTGPNCEFAACPTQ